MEITSEKEKEIIEYGDKKNLLIESNAIELLKTMDNFREILDQLQLEENFIVSREHIEKEFLKAKMSAESPKDEVMREKSFKPMAKDYSPNMKFFKEYDVTGQSNTEGTVKDFLGFFQNRFKQLSEMFRNRQGFAPRPIRRVISAGRNEEVDAVGMVYKKWKTKNDHIALQVEDLEEKCIVLLLKSDQKMSALAEKVMPDDVIGIKGTKVANELIIAKDIFWPDIPMNKQKTVPLPLSIAGTSDIHVGSKLFLEKEFNSFLEWINGKCDESEKEIVGKIKYLLITGDNVDGIGIYPNQQKELRIMDIYAQYEEFCRLIAQIPEYIEVIITPGNHDAVRRADPQPALGDALVKQLKGLKNIHFVGSPSLMEIEGLKVMLYHGGSLHDLVSSVSFLDSSHPEKAMVELLTKRNLMPSYGLGQPYVPEKKDFLTIKEIPDYIFFGDIHHNGYTNYRGTTIINSGTWQARTSYQVKLGHIPTPGIVPIVDIDTGKIKEKRFYFGGEGENAA